MEFHMFRNRTIDELQEKYNELNMSQNSDTDDGKVPEDLVPDEIKFKPSPRLRKKHLIRKGLKHSHLVMKLILLLL